jgi:hypothetical protein
MRTVLLKTAYQLETGDQFLDEAKLNKMELEPGHRGKLASLLLSSDQPSRDAIAYDKKVAEYGTKKFWEDNLAANGYEKTLETIRAAGCDPANDSRIRLAIGEVLRAGKGKAAEEALKYVNSLDPEAKKYYIPLIQEVLKGDCSPEFKNLAAVSLKPPAKAFEDPKKVKAALDRGETEFLKWLAAQKVDINDPTVRTIILDTMIKEKGLPPVQALRAVIAKGKEAKDYKDALVEYIKSPDLTKDMNVRVALVSALVNIDPTMKAELTTLTAGWAKNRSEQGRIDRALKGEARP